MLFENLSVDRLIIHEVYRRRDDKQPIPPIYGGQLLQLDADAMGMFRDRVIAALGSQSQSMEMAVSQYEQGSSIEIARDLVGASHADFVAGSRRFADKLVSAQAARNLPGGVLVVFSGQAGNPARQIIGVIKAETHSGFRRTTDMQVQYFKDLFMTPQTKLYKIGVFAYSGGSPIPPLPAGWTPLIYDSQMSSANRDGAAQYFYESFLGCTLPVNSAQLTKRFYEETRNFIKKVDVPEEQKSDLLTGLYTYLKVDQSPTVELATFSNQYLMPSLRDDYTAYMNSKAFPTNAVPKDTSDIQGYLRRRKLTFSRNIQLTAPPDAYQDLVRVQTLGGEDDDGNPMPWTQITIRDRIRGQE
jgi:nucleoid-associated protein YejK